MLCGAHMLVLRIIQELWQSSGGVFNVDEVLQQMVFGLEDELELRSQGVATEDPSLRGIPRPDGMACRNCPLGLRCSGKPAGCPWLRVRCSAWYSLHTLQSATGCPVRVASAWRFAGHCE